MIFLFIIRIGKSILNMLIKFYKHFAILDFIAISLNANSLLLK
jgi:hypothetical protein